MGLWRLLLGSWILLGAIIGAELAWVRRESTGMVALFSHEDAREPYQPLYFHQPQLGFVRVKNDVRVFGKTVDQRGLLYSSPTSTHVYEFRTDGSQHLLFEAPLEAVEFIDTSPAGNWYLFLNNLNLEEYYLVRTDGNEWHTIASPTRNIFTFFRWSNDGEWLFFENHETNGASIMYRVQTISGVVEKIAEGSYRGMSPDSEWLFLFADGNISRVRPNGSAQEQLAQHEGYIDIVDMDEQNAWLVYQAYNYATQVFEVWYLDLQTRETKRILVNSDDTFAIESNWALDELLVYTLPTFDGHFAIYTIHPDGSERQLVVEKAHEKYVAWLNEDLILYSDGIHSYLKRVSDGYTLQLTEYDPDHSTYIRLNDDQKQLVIGYWRQRPFLEIDLGTGQRRFLTKDPADFIYLGELQFVGRKWHPLGLGIGIMVAGLIFGLLQWKLR